MWEKKPSFGTKFHYKELIAWFSLFFRKMGQTKIFILKFIVKKLYFKIGKIELQKRNQNKEEIVLKKGNIDVEILGGKGIKKNIQEGRGRIFFERNTINFTMQVLYLSFLRFVLNYCKKLFLKNHATRWLRSCGRPWLENECLVFFMVFSLNSIKDLLLNFTSSQISGQSDILDHPFLIDLNMLKLNCYGNQI